MFVLIRFCFGVGLMFDVAFLFRRVVLIRAGVYVVFCFGVWGFPTRVLLCVFVYVGFVLTFELFRNGCCSICVVVDVGVLFDVGCLL